ncbi:MAG: T9SS type A sorting domain-containing protein [Saprospiraceae bacterium]|nr:T9SS type A sorting domain-containing protein [Candidatus Vicinibacter proximus]
MNFKYYLVYILIFVVIEIKAQFYQTLNTSIKPTYSEINENGDIILVQSTSFDSVEILNSVLKPLSNPRPIFGRSKEIYITRIDTNQQILDNIHFYSKEGINIIGSYLFNDEYYFILTNFDTIFYKDTFYTNDINILQPTYLFKFDFNTRDLVLCKLIGGGWEWSSIFIDESYINIGLQFIGSAVIDSNIFNGLKPSFNEKDIILIKLLRSNYNLKAATTLIGFEDSYPLKFISSDNRNLYLLVDTYSPFLICNKDSILFPKSSNGYGLALKFEEDLTLSKFAATSGIFTDININNNNSIDIVGNYYNELVINNKAIANSFGLENSFIARFDQLLNLESYKEYKGSGSKRFSIIGNVNNNDIFLGGQFTKQIHEENNKVTQSEGDFDALTYFINNNGELVRKFYFQGDSTEFISKILQKKNGDFFILGHTLSKKLVCSNDIIYPDWDRKSTRINFFLYKIDAKLLKSIEIPPKQEDYIRIASIQLNKIVKIEIISNIVNRINIYNSNGHLCNARNITPNKQLVEIENISVSGLYFISVHLNNGKNFTKKVVVLD